MRDLFPIVLGMSLGLAVPGCTSLRDKHTREVKALGITQPAPSTVAVAEADLAPLPATARRYLRAMGVVGRSRDLSLRARFTGRFRRGFDAPWTPCETWQYNSRDELARLFYLELRVGPIPFIGRDTYLRGHGRMLGRALDLVTVLDDSSEELAQGELVTWLNDAVLLAPSMLLIPAVRFAEVDDDAFDLSLADAGRSVRARVFVDAAGLPQDFETTDRYYEDPKTKRNVRGRWRTPVASWIEVGGRKLMASGKAVWLRDGGAFEYADFQLDPSSVAFDVAPGD
jgi:hypothetical protein